jgi:acyl-CoA synthetase (AMP-forming)/AMP-acid ligase II
MLRDDWGLKKGDRAVLVYLPGLDFIAAFLGCLRAGVLAVPVYPPHPNSLQRDLPKLYGICDNCSPSAILTTSDFLWMTRAGDVKRVLMECADFLRGAKPSPDAAWPAGVPWYCTDGDTSGREEISPPYVDREAVHGDDIAFLQYTSGSTGNPKGVMVSPLFPLPPTSTHSPSPSTTTPNTPLTLLTLSQPSTGNPKGVMVSHANLEHNLELIRKYVQIDEASVNISWLPQYHDMGTALVLLLHSYCYCTHSATLLVLLYSY